MRLTIAYSKIKKPNLELINNDTYQRETLSERPIRQPLTLVLPSLFSVTQFTKEWLRPSCELENWTRWNI